MLERELLAGEWSLPSSFAARARKRLLWYVNRLRCMRPPEMAHRLLRAAAARAECWGLTAASEVPETDWTVASRPWVYPPESPGQQQECLAAAERIIAGRFDVFALRDVDLGSPPRWNRDPKTGLEAPLRFGKLLDYRNAEQVGDIKYLWEPNRHQHLVTLAQAYALSREHRYFQAIRGHLESWFDACPHAKGPNWCSALEAAMRLISWSIAWQLLGGKESRLFSEPSCRAFRAQWLQSVFRHARFIHGYFSRYSSANNHLLGEAAGLYIAATTWPCWPQASRWKKSAQTVLEREILLQNGTDGVNLEQAVGYQRFDLELLLLCWLAAEAHGEDFSPAFRSRIESMLEYLASIMDVGGNVPMIGDCDDATVCRLDHRPDFCGYRSLLAIGALLFGRGDFKAKAGGLDERTRWLVRNANSAYEALNAQDVVLPVRQAFPVGGYYVLGCDFETEKELRLIVDAGPLGYQTIAAHGHADALAFTLSVGGKEIFIDPGTYAYHTEEPWRQYFRGTAAHNTVRVDGHDQSTSGGKFMWVKKAQAGCDRWSSSPEKDVFEGWHDGYLRLASPVLHRRKIVLHKRSRSILIEDTLQARGRHTIELFFHCSERCRVERASDGYRIVNGDRQVTLKPPPSVEEQRVYSGSTAPILGWISRRFDERQPAATLVWRCVVRGEQALRTQIVC